MDQRARSPIIRSFERHLRALNRSERTIETYLISLRQAEAFLRIHGTTLEAATRADLEAFMANVLARGRAPSTAATYHKVLKLLYAWLVEEEEIPTDPMAKLRPPIVPDKPVPIVPADALKRLQRRSSDLLNPGRSPGLQPVGSRVSAGRSTNAAAAFGLAQERLCGPAGTRPGVAQQRTVPAQSRSALPVRSCPPRERHPHAGDDRRRPPQGLPHRRRPERARPAARPAAHPGHPGRLSAVAPVGGALAAALLGGGGRPRHRPSVGSAAGR
jgi:Phage integrase, N-terminal SAM-like domain